MLIPRSLKRGFACFALITTTFTILFLLVDLDKQTMKNTKTDLRNLAGGAIAQKVCGADYNSASAQASADADRVAARDQRKAVQDMRGGKNTIDDYLRDGSSANQTNAAMALIMSAAPWLVMMVFSLWGWFCYCLCCVCDCCCPPSKCCRCPPKDPKEPGLYYVWPIVGGGIFCLWVFIVAIIGLSTAGDLKTSYNKLHCAVISLLDDIVNGALQGTPDEWVGIAKLLTRIGDFTLEVTKFITEVKAMFNPRPWLTQLPLDINNQINALKTKELLDAADFDPTTVQFPNPVYNYATDVAAGGLVDDVYFKSIFVPALDAMKSIINTGVDQINQQFVLLDEKGVKISSDSDNFQNTIIDGQNQVNDMVNSLNDQMKSADDSLSSGDGVFDIITLILQAYYGVCMGLSILSILGILLIMVFKKNGFRICLHITWCFFCLLMIVGFLLGTILMTLSHVTMDVCGVLDNMLSSKEQFQSYSQIPSSMKDKLPICFKTMQGNGDILTSFGVKDKLNDVNNLENEIKKTDQVTQDVSSIVTLEEKTSIIADQLTELKTYGTFQGNYDGVEATAAYIAIKSAANINEYIPNTPSNTYLLATSCPSSIIVDNWVQNTTSCTTPSTVSTTYNNVETDKTGKCYVLSNVALADYTSRYNVIPPSCTFKPNHFQISLTSMITLFKTFLSDLATKANKKLTLYNSGVKASISTYIGNLNSTIALFQSFNPKTKNIINLVTSPTVGILAQTSCIFLGDNTFKFIDAICVSFVPTIFSLAKIIVVMSVGMFVGSFFLFCAGVRFSNKSKFEEQDNPKVSDFTNTKQEAGY